MDKSVGEYIRSLYKTFGRDTVPNTICNPCVFDHSPSGKEVVKRHNVDSYVCSVNCYL